MKKITITIELEYDDTSAAEETKTADPNQPYWDDEMEDMLADYE